MAQINVAVLNRQGSNYNVQVFDQFGNANREVNGSPFPLASGDQSPFFIVNSDGNGVGYIAYNCQVNGPTLSHVEVKESQVVPI